MLLERGRIGALIWRMPDEAVQNASRALDKFEQLLVTVFNGAGRIDLGQLVAFQADLVANGLPPEIGTYLTDIGSISCAAVLAGKAPTCSSSSDRATKNVQSA
jgi:hypothetical protein